MAYKVKKSKGLEFYNKSIYNKRPKTEYAKGFKRGYIQAIEEVKK